MLGTTSTTILPLGKPDGTSNSPPAANALVQALLERISELETTVNSAVSQLAALRTAAQEALNHSAVVSKNNNSPKSILKKRSVTFEEPMDVTQSMESAQGEEEEEEEGDSASFVETTSRTATGKKIAAMKPSTSPQSASSAPTASSKTLSKKSSKTSKTSKPSEKATSGPTTGKVKKVSELKKGAKMSQTQTLLDLGAKKTSSPSSIAEALSTTTSLTSSLEDAATSSTSLPPPPPSSLQKSSSSSSSSSSSMSSSNHVQETEDSEQPELSPELSPPRPAGAAKRPPQVTTDFEDESEKNTKKARTSNSSSSSSLSSSDSSFDHSSPTKNTLDNSSSPSSNTIKAAVESPLKAAKRALAGLESDEAMPSPSPIKASQESTTSSVEETQTVKVPPRWGHAATSWKVDSLIIFGGSNSTSDHLDDLWELNSNTGIWTAPVLAASSPRPPAVMGHSLSTVSTLMPRSTQVYLIGGALGSNKWSSDVWKLDQATMVWTKLETQGKFAARAYHSAVVVGKEIWVFGGTAKNKSFKDLSIFDTSRNLWSQPTTTGVSPPARSGASMLVVPTPQGQQLVVFGGADWPVIFNDVYLLETATMEWRKLTLAHDSIPPSPRTWTAGVGVGSGRVLYMGGYDGDTASTDIYILDIRTGQWHPFAHADLQIHARAGHTLTQVSDRVVLFGGGNNDGDFYSDWVTMTVALHPSPTK